MSIKVGLWSVAILAMIGCYEFSESLAWAGEENEVIIEKVEVRFLTHGPVVLLEVDDRAIPIYVDPTVAGSIHGALSGQKFPRPLSHDLMHTILEAYQVTIKRVFITLKDGVYYGTLTLSMDGQTKVFDSRSSDAIALAIHFRTPIIVEKDLLDSAGKKFDEEKGAQVLL